MLLLSIQEDEIMENGKYRFKLKFDTPVSTPKLITPTDVDFYYLNTYFQSDQKNTNPISNVRHMTKAAGYGEIFGYSYITPWHSYIDNTGTIIVSGESRGILDEMLDYFRIVCGVPYEVLNIGGGYFSLYFRYQYFNSTYEQLRNEAYDFGRVLNRELDIRGSEVSVKPLFSPSGSGDGGSGGSGGSGGGSGGGTGSGGSGSGGTTDVGMTDTQAQALGRGAMNKMKTDLQNGNVRIEKIIRGSDGNILLEAAGVGANVNGITLSFLSFLDQSNADNLRAAKFGRNLGVLGTVIGGMQTYIAFSDGEVSYGDIVGAVSAALGTVGSVCAFIPGLQVVSGVLGVTSCIIGLVSTAMRSEARLIEVRLENNKKIYIYIGGSTPSPLIA